MFISRNRDLLRLTQKHTKRPLCISLRAIFVWLVANLGKLWIGTLSFVRLTISEERQWRGAMIYAQKKLKANVPQKRTIFEEFRLKTGNF